MHYRKWIQNPFFETPEKAHLPNNKSSLKNEKFVLDSISEA